MRRSGWHSVCAKSSCPNVFGLIYVRTIASNKVLYNTGWECFVSVSVLTPGGSVVPGSHKTFSYGIFLLHPLDCFIYFSAWILPFELYEIFSVSLQSMSLQTRWKVSQFSWNSWLNLQPRMFHIPILFSFLLFLQHLFCPQLNNGTNESSEFTLLLLYVLLSFFS